MDAEAAALAADPVLAEEARRAQEDLQLQDASISAPSRMRSGRTALTTVEGVDEAHQCLAAAAAPALTGSRRFWRNLQPRHALMPTSDAAE